VLPEITKLRASLLVGPGAGTAARASDERNSTIGPSNSAPRPKASDVSATLSRRHCGSRSGSRDMAGEDIYGSSEHQAFRAVVRKFVETELAPRAREFDAMGRPDKTARRDGAARDSVRPEVRRAGAGLLLPRGVSGGAHPVRQRRGRDWHHRPDRHGHAGAPPVRDRASSRSTWCPRSAASRWRRSR
jgi:acyl-CoA dehydrogenase-like protein